MDRKTSAKRKMLEMMSKNEKDKMYGSLGDELKDKKLKKVTVASDSPEGLKKGLSLAEKLLAKKFGQDSDKNESSIEDHMEADEEHSCPMCEDEGCEECEEVEDAE